MMRARLWAIKEVDTIDMKRDSGDDTYGKVVDDDLDSDDSVTPQVGALVETFLPLTSLGSPLTLGRKNCISFKTKHCIRET